jgi:hypothetical protein
LIVAIARVFSVLSAFGSCDQAMPAIAAEERSVRTVSFIVGDRNSFGSTSLVASLGYNQGPTLLIELEENIHPPDV